MMPHICLYLFVVFFYSTVVLSCVFLLCCLCRSQLEIAFKTKTNFHYKPLHSYRYTGLDTDKRLNWNTVAVQ